MSTEVILTAPQRQRWILIDHAREEEYPVASCLHAYNILKGLPGIRFRITQGMVQELAARNKGKLVHRFTLDKLKKKLI